MNFQNRSGNGYAAFELEAVVLPGGSSPFCFNQRDSIEPLVSDGNLRSCFLGRGGLDGPSGTRRDGRVVAFRRIRVGSWNVGSLTGKLLELVDTLERRKVDIACFQETKWKGASNREANGYKLWYSGSPTPVVDMG
ncbi:cleavage/polyadenylation specificity factor, 25kDa subunit [Tanacetum coccineum]